MRSVAGEISDDCHWDEMDYGHRMERMFPGYTVDNGHRMNWPIYVQVCREVDCEEY